MKRLSVLTLLVLATSLFAQEENYPLHEDAVEKEGIPRGEVIRHIWKNSTVFPDTIREYYVYVPAQYSPSRPAALMIFQDGHTFVSRTGDYRVPTVFDNLIHQGQMPVTIGLFINPGHKGETLPDNPWRANNRSFEYDTLNGDYARFLIEEIIPAVSEDYHLTGDPDYRALCGNSSGGICAFTAAWERPDYFRKVVSHIGSFTNIRGGHDYPALIRKTEAKPIRVFIQEGLNDLDNRHGNWPLANMQMETALKFMNYDYRAVWGVGAHNGKHSGAIFPDTLRWLWRDFQ